MGEQAEAWRAATEANEIQVQLHLGGVDEPQDQERSAELEGCSRMVREREGEGDIYPSLGFSHS